MSRGMALPGAWARRRHAGLALADPLLRNGHALVLSSGATSVVGLLYWAFAARSYDPATLGRNSVAISAMMFIGGVAQLNLTSALTRFIPGAGSRTRAFVLYAYGLSVAVSLVLSTAFLALVGTIAPSLGFLQATPSFAAWFMISSAAWAVFVLQDSVLTGLRRTGWVPVENAVFALLKVALVAVLASLLRTDGIFVSWTLATVVMTIPTNVYLFTWAIPRHPAPPAGSRPLELRQLTGYVPLDYLGSMCWLGATSLLPLLVIDMAGAAASAFFALAWVIAYALYLVPINMGSSLVVETALDTSALERRLRQLTSHLLLLLVPAVVVVVAGAPEILRLFGTRYGAQGGTTLRLLALSALPAIVSSTAVSAARAMRRMRLALAIPAALFALSFGLSLALIPVLGIAAVGWAWLGGQTVTAGALLATRSRWLSAARSGDGSPAAGAGVPWPGQGMAGGGVRAAVGLALARTMVRTGVARSVPAIPHHLPQRLPAGVRRELLDALEVLAAVAGGAGDPGRPAPVLRVLRRANDLTVALATGRDGLPETVVKIPHSAEALEDLRSRHLAIAAMVGDGRVWPWSTLLTPTYRLHEDGRLAFATETYVPGVDGHALLRREPGRLPTLLRASLEAIGELHRRTASSLVVDDPAVARWVSAPCELLESLHPSGRAGARRRLAVGRLEERLGTAMAGQRVTVSWCHGDFTPGNVVLSDDGTTVSGILDWGRSRPADLPAVDNLLMIVAARSQAEHREIGHVVVSILASGRLAGDDRRLVSGPASSPGGVEPGDLQPDLQPGGLQDVTLTLLCWLHHVTANLSKSRRYAQNPLWWAANVEPVLRWVSR
ncbi:MAG: phosphotransferase [Acidimicrobiales bacterium]